MKDSVNIINRRAKYEYEFLRKEIAGIVLTGSEVKSIKSGKISLSESYCLLQNGEIILKNATISDLSDTHGKDRKLLLKKREIRRFEKELIKGLSIIPYRIFMNEKGLLKVEVILCRGKKTYDKREVIKKRDLERLS